MSYITLNQNYGYTPYKVTNLAAGSTIDATGATWIVDNSANDFPDATHAPTSGTGKLNTYPFKVDGAGAGLLIKGGAIWGQVPQQSDWQYTYNNSAGIRVANAPGVIIDDWRLDSTWDAIRIASGATNFLIDDTWITNVRDDAVENDYVLGGTIRDSLFDGVFSGISLGDSDHYDGSMNTLTLDGLMMRNKPYLFEGKVTHETPFKCDTGAPGTTPDIRIDNSVIAIEDVNHAGQKRLQIAWDHVVESHGNVFLNLSDTPLPSTYPKPPAGFTILQGQQARDYWEACKAAWHANHDGVNDAGVTALPPLPGTKPAGDDMFVNHAGNEKFDGGAGMDTVAYSGLFHSYDVHLQGGAGTVAGGAEGGTDTLSSIESIQFRDGKLVFNADGVAAQVTRLYDTVLNRAPDQAGLDTWVDQIEDRGGTLKQVATGFLNSPEFHAATGSLSNADYVEYLYHNALGRASDAAGKANWVNSLNSGTSDRADVLIAFSESAEHRSQTADLVSHGFFNTNDAYQSVALLYDSFAGRLPDAAGLINWAEAIKSGAMTEAQVADGFANSAEFHHLTDGMTHGQLVEFMYHNTLDRASDPAGYQYWTNALDHGLTNGGLLDAFAQSSEHFTLLGAHVTNGIDYL